jgi:hypothetical protein
MITEPPYLITRGTVDPLKNQETGFRRTGFVEISNYRIGDGIFYAGNKDVGTGFDEPKLHTSPYGGGQIIGYYD